MDDSLNSGAKPAGIAKLFSVTRRAARTQSASNLVGKRAATEEELRIEAQAYVRARMYSKGGLKEGLCGFWHKTLPFLLGRETKLTFGGVFALAIRLVVVCGAAFLPILGRRAMVSAHAQEPGWTGFLGLLGDLAAIDYALAAGGILFFGLPKLVDAWTKKRSARPHAPYGDLAAAIEKMPPLDLVGEQQPKDALTHALAALQTEMSELIADPGRKRVTDVTLLQYCDDAGTRMEVTARTAVGEATHRPRSARLFLANYVGREGRWFAENDFLRRQNPFKARRLTVVGSPRVDYRSVLYLPILTAVRVHELHEGQAGPIDVVDCCMGVICVQSDKPYRFWRWGDHNKDNGGGFGNVAIERALPYIALVTRLVERSAHKVPLETA